jgi:hypothetical protein
MFSLDNNRFRKKEFWGAVIGAAVSLYEGQKADQRADDAAAAANATREERLAIAQESYDNYKETFGPNEQALVEMVDNFTMRDNLERYRTEGVVNVQKAMDKSQEMQKREMSRYGLDPSSGRYQSGQRELGIERAKGEVSALNRARTQAEEERLQDEDRLFSRRLAVGQFGRQPITAERDLSAAYGNQLSDLRKEEAGYADQASAGYGLAGEFLGDAADSYSSSSSASDYGGSAVDYGDGMMTDDYGDFSSGDLGW